MPSYLVTAPAVFLAAQSRVLPRTAELLGLGSADQLLAADPQLSEQITKARAALLDAGCRSSQVPFGAAEPSAQKRARNMVKPQQRKLRDSLRQELPAFSAARFNSHASSKASNWLNEHFPGGSPKPGATWRTMTRHRPLMVAPGLPQPHTAATTCRHCTREGRPCPCALDPAGVHEHLCNLGGGVDGRHNALRDWLGDKVRDAQAWSQEAAQPTARLRPCRRRP